MPQKKMPPQVDHKTHLSSTSSCFAHPTCQTRTLLSWFQTEYIVHAETESETLSSNPTQWCTYLCCTVCPSGTAATVIWTMGWQNFLSPKISRSGWRQNRFLLRRSYSKEPQYRCTSTVSHIWEGKAYGNVEHRRYEKKMLSQLHTQRLWDKLEVVILQGG